MDGGNGTGAHREPDREAARRAIERWFSTRGVPQLIEGYSSEQRIDARALPLIGVWIVVGTALIWVPGPQRPLADNLTALLVTLAASGLVIGVSLKVRGRPPFGSHTRLDPGDIAVLGLVPGIIAAVLAGDLGARVAIPGFASLLVVTFILLGVGVVYAVVALGLPELTGWGMRYLRDNLPHVATLVARALPLLLILVVFLLFAAELWQAAQALGPGDLVALIALLAVVGGVLVVSQATEAIGAIEDRGFAETLDGLLAGTPAAELRQGVPVPSARRLQALERLNLVVLMLVSQLVQALFVALMVALFLVVLGMIAVPAQVQAAWAGAPVRDLVTFVFLGEPRALSLELLITAGLLSGVCGLYFTGLALTDATYRDEFDRRVVADIERILAVRSVYLAVPETGDPPGA